MLAALHTAVRDKQTTRVGEMRDAAFKNQILGAGVMPVAAAVEKGAGADGMINAAPAPSQQKVECMFHHIGRNCLKGKDCRFLQNLTSTEKAQLKTKHDEWSHRQK